MKIPVKAYSFILFTLLVFAVKAKAGSNDPDVEKKKTYSKSYPVNNSDKITLDNRFGELKISTWDKNEVKVDITITAKANSDDRAQEILDRISISDGKNGSGVYFKTDLDDDKKDWDKGNKKEHRNESFSIDYVVSLPSRNPLKALMEFGGMTIGDYNGEVVLESKFGSLTAGKLSNPKRVDVEFGKLILESMNGGELTVKFSRAEVNNLDGSVKANFEHCSGIKLNLDNNLKELNIKNSFTPLYLNASSNLSASFDVYTNFAELKNKSNFNIKEEGENDEDHGPKFDHQYSGKAGGGSIAIKIKSEFGQVTLGHNLTFDVNEKDKEGKKTRDI